MPNIGPTELIIVLVIVLVIFGPKKLPGLGRSLGTSMREFKDSITGKDDDKSLPEADDDDASPRRQSSTTTPSAARAADPRAPSTRLTWHARCGRSVTRIA